MDNIGGAGAGSTASFSQLEQVAVANSQSLYTIQAQAAKQLAANSHQQAQLGEAIVAATKQMTDEVIKQIQNMAAAMEKQAETSKAQDVFSYLLTACAVVGSLLIGQPEIAAITLTLFILQKTGATDKIESFIGGDGPENAWKRALVGVAISGVAASVGGGSSILTSGCSLLRTVGTSMMCGITGLTSTGLQANLTQATHQENTGGAIGISAAFLAVGLIGGICGGAMLAKAGTSLVQTGMLAKAAFAFSLSGTITGAAGQSGAGIANGCFTLQVANATEAKSKAAALITADNQLKEMATAQSQDFARKQTYLMTECSTLVKRICEGMSSMYGGHTARA